MRDDDGIYFGGDSGNPLVAAGGGGDGGEGYTGPTGYTGPDGDPGDPGPTGDTGYTGYTGYTGPSGGEGGLEDVRWNQSNLRLEKKLAGGDWETVVQFAAFDSTVS